MNIEHQMQKLEENFGKKVASELRIYIEKNLDYKFLKQFVV